MKQSVLNCDKRMYRRLSASFAVRFSFGKEDDIIRKGRCLNIGADGMCFLTEYPLPLHKKIAVWIDVDESGASLHKKATVVWQRAIAGGLFRVGVVFESVSFLEMWRLL